MPPIAGDSGHIPDTFDRLTIAFAVQDVPKPPLIDPTDRNVPLKFSLKPIVSVKELTLAPEFGNAPALASNVSALLDKANTFMGLQAAFPYVARLVVLVLDKGSLQA